MSYFKLDNHEGIFGNTNLTRGELSLNKTTTTSNININLADIIVNSAVDASNWPTISLHAGASLEVNFTSTCKTDFAVWFSLNYFAGTDLERNNTYMTVTLTDETGLNQSFTIAATAMMYSGREVRNFSEIPSGPSKLTFTTGSNSNDIILGNIQVGPMEIVHCESEGFYISQIYDSPNTSKFKMLWETEDATGIKVELVKFAKDDSYTTEEIQSNTTYTYTNYFDRFKYVVTLTKHDNYIPIIKPLHIITKNEFGFNLVDNASIRGRIDKSYIYETINNLLMLTSAYDDYTLDIMVEIIKHFKDKNAYNTTISIKEYNGIVDIIDKIRSLNDLEASGLSYISEGQVVTLQDLKDINSAITSITPVAPQIALSDTYLVKDYPTLTKFHASNNNVNLVNCVGPNLRGAYIDPTIYGNGVISRVSFSPDGKYLAQVYSPSYYGDAVTIYEKIEDTFVFKSELTFTEGYTGDVYWGTEDYLYVSVGNYVMECSMNNGSVRVHNPIIDLGENISRIRMSPDGTWLVAVAGCVGAWVTGNAYLHAIVYKWNEISSTWELNLNYQPTMTIKAWYNTIAFSPDSKWMYIGASGAIGSDSVNTIDTLYTFKIEEGSITFNASSVPVAGSGVGYISFPNESNYVYLLCGKNLCLGTWNSTTGVITILNIFDSLPINWTDSASMGSESELACSNDGRFCGIGFRGNAGDYTRIYKRDGNTMTKLDWNCLGGYGTSIAFLQNDYMAYGTKSGGTYVVRIMDTHTDLEDISVNTKTVESIKKYVIQWSPSAEATKLIYDTSNNGDIVCYETYLSKDTGTTWQLLNTSTPIQNPSLSFDITNLRCTPVNEDGTYYIPGVASGNLTRGMFIDLIGDGSTYTLRMKVKVSTGKVSTKIERENKDILYQYTHEGDNIWHQYTIPFVALPSEHTYISIVMGTENYEAYVKDISLTKNNTLPNLLELDDYLTSPSIKVVAYNRLGISSEVTKDITVLSTGQISTCELSYQDIQGVWHKTNDIATNNTIETAIIPGIINYKLNFKNSDGVIVNTKVFQTI